MSQSDPKERTTEDCARELQEQFEFTLQNSAIVGTAFQMFPGDELSAMKQAIISLYTSNERLVEQCVAWRQRFQ